VPTRERVERAWLAREVDGGQQLNPQQVAEEFGVGVDYARQLLRDLRLARLLDPELRAIRGIASADLSAVAGGPNDPLWRDRAACLGEDPELFFPEKGEWAKAERAKRICRGCSVQGACLHESLYGPQAAADEVGIFGGTTPRERRGLRRRTWTGTPARVTRDRDLAVQALERAGEVGRDQAARELGISRVALTRAWQRFGLELPPRRIGGRVPPTRFYTDRAAAEAILARAREIGISAAAKEAGVSRIALDSAWRRWSMERPSLPSGRRPGSQEQAPRLDRSFLALNPALAATLPRRASGTEVAARLRRLEELETLTPRVRSALHDENVPRPAVRAVFIGRRARHAIERAQAAAEHPAVTPAEERRRAAERLARAHARRVAERERQGHRERVREPKERER
jgi:WhiB family transcriptional regulator, redox-sensing transcriptional regulator